MLPEKEEEGKSATLKADKKVRRLVKKRNVQLAKGEQALVRQRRIERRMKNNPNDQNAPNVICREDGIRKFQGYFQRLLAINSDYWKEAVQHTRVYFPDDRIVLGIVPEENAELKSRVLGFLAKTESPSGTALEKTPKQYYHMVSSGDTLYGISHRYGVSVEKICLLNQLDRGEVVYPGQTLRLIGVHP